MGWIQILDQYVYVKRNHQIKFVIGFNDVISGVHVNEHGFKKICQRVN